MLPMRLNSFSAPIAGRSSPCCLLRHESLHVREIARLTGVPPGSLHRELKALSEAGLLLRESAGNQVRLWDNGFDLATEFLYATVRAQVSA
jgi:DNA-binding IclR family transcriptional regulator